MSGMFISNVYVTQNDHMQPPYVTHHFKGHYNGKCITDCIVENVGKTEMVDYIFGLLMQQLYSAG